MRLALTGLAVLGACALAACSPSAPVAHHDETAHGCIANAEARWTRPGAPVLDASASTIGPDCEHAVATLVVRDPAGVTVYTEAFPAEHVMVLSEAHDADAMQGSLVHWLDQSNATMKSTGDLPAWARDAENPTSGEFPFMPEQSIDRTAYATLRTHPEPMYCFVQGMESQACLVWQNNELDKIGVQTFPG